MEKGEALYYVPVNPLEVPGYNAHYDYAAIGVTGGCMDSADSPLRIPDRAEVLGHFVSRKDFLRDWEKYQGRVISIFPNDYLKAKDERGLTKELVRVDYGWFIVLRMYVPFKEFSVPADRINDEVFIIDKVIGQR
jgi:hypothetical protein